MKHGNIALAKVEHVDYSGPNSRNTLDAMKNGIAFGSWRLPDGLRKSFQIDSFWAKEIKIGSQIEVLQIGSNSGNVFPINIRE